MSFSNLLNWKKKDSWTADELFISQTDTEFRRIYSKTNEYSMTSKERSLGLYNAVRYVVDNEIEGDFVECGVWRGGSIMMICEVLMSCNVMNRNIFLYDTFAGMPQPSDDDVAYNGEKAIDGWNAKKSGDHNECCYCSLDCVKENIALTGYDPDHLFFGFSLTSSG